MARRTKTFDKIVEIIKKDLKPKRLFLFGSQATGKATARSDYDFVVVVPKKHGTRMCNWERVAERIWDECSVSADVFVYSEKEFNDWKDEFSSIPETALNTGREIEL